MKKLLCTAAIAVLGFTSVYAQEVQDEKEVSSFGFEKGNIIIEGNLGFDSSKSIDSDNSGDFLEEKSTSLNFNPKAGYFISDDLVVGVELNIESAKNETSVFSPNSTQETKLNSLGFGVFARYYFLELGKRFKTYGEFGVGFNSAKLESSVTGSASLLQDSEFKGVNAGLGLGINYFISESFAINFGLTDLLAFSSAKGTNNLSTTGEETKETSFNGNFNIFNNFFNTAQFGLTYKF